MMDPTDGHHNVLIQNFCQCITNHRSVQMSSITNQITLLVNLITILVTQITNHPPILSITNNSVTNHQSVDWSVHGINHQSDYHFVNLLPTTNQINIFVNLLPITNFIDHTQISYQSPTLWITVTNQSRFL